MNTKGGSPGPACACATPLCAPECASSGVPAHTHAVPDTPDAPTQLADLALEELKIRSLFVSWALPYSHELPLLASELRVANLTYVASAAETSFNISGLTPATQYPARVRVLNAVGFSEWSGVSWLSTKPDVPGRPAELSCDPLRASDTSFHVQLGETNDNGVPIDRYELRVWQGALDVTPALRHTSPVFASDFSGVELSYEVDAASVTAANGSHTLWPQQEYTVLLRAHNAIGWGPWSDAGLECATIAPPTAPFPMMLLILALGGLIGALLCCMFVWWKTNLPKILAPALRKKEVNMDPFEDFVARDEDPMEDHDPDLVMNPIMLARIQLEKEAKMKKASKKIGDDAGGKSGGLKRLNFRLSKAEAKPETKTQKIHMKHIDAHLKKEEEASKTHKFLAAAAAGSTSTEHSDKDRRTDRDEPKGKSIVRWQLAGKHIKTERESARKVESAYVLPSRTKTFTTTAKNLTLLDVKKASLDEVAGVLADDDAPERMSNRDHPHERDRITTKV